MKAVILGCGNSSGVPAIGNYWGACNPDNPKNLRGRSSLAVMSDSTTIIIDTGAEFREQFNRENLPIPDAVFYTHEHGDHCHGIDDLRSFRFHLGEDQMLDIYGSASTIKDIKKRFPYLFNKGGKGEKFYPPMLKSNIFAGDDFGKPHRIGDIDFIPFEIDHGIGTCTGFRFSDMAYCVDLKSLDDKAIEIIKGVRNWIVDAAAYKNRNNFVHASIDDIINYNKIIRAQNVYITSLTTQMDYDILTAELPEGFYPAYDGLKIEINTQ